MRNDSTQLSLAAFIQTNLERILEEWEKFARTVASAEGLDTTALRDHAKQLLLAIAEDMESEQSCEEQEAKSKGKRPDPGNSRETAAESHGEHRFDEGFDLNEMISEYRALRATVVRLWTEDRARPDTYELTRFNEAIDESVAQSVARFSIGLDRSRQLFMGVLGHDLRTHLHVILSSASKVRASQASEVQQRYCNYIEQSAEQINRMVNDLLDMARTRLGSELPLEPAFMDAGALCGDVLMPFRILHPQRQIRCELVGDLQGHWDRARLHQLLANLVRNAIQHGNADSPVTLAAIEDGDSVLFKVHNQGEPIPRSLLHHIFQPMQQGNSGRGRDSTSVGLGLYIACTIAQRHGGTITVESTQEQGTTFVASLPKGSLNS